MKLIVPGMKAHLADGSIVEIVDVASDAHTGHEPYLVLAAHGLFGPDVAAPITSIWRVDKDVHLALSAKEAAALPRVVPPTHAHRERGYIAWAPRPQH